MEKAKQEIIGIVVGDSADKTITVKVETYKKHPLYGKIGVKVWIYKGEILTSKGNGGKENVNTKKNKA